MTAPSEASKGNEISGGHKLGGNKTECGWCWVCNDHFRDIKKEYGEEGERHGNNILSGD